jgi:hypothetical protein
MHGCPPRFPGSIVMMLSYDMMSAFYENEHPTSKQRLGSTVCQSATGQNHGSVEWHMAVEA